MKKVILLCILFSITALKAQSIKIWDKMEQVENGKQSELTVFKADTNPNGGAIIICPGGSYVFLGINREGYDVAEWLNSKGITVFVLNYRRAYRNHHPAMIQDLQRSTQIVKERAKEFEIDPDKLGLMGFSAGGHLVGIASTYYDVNFMEQIGINPAVSLKPAFTAMIYPIVSMTDSLAHKRSRKNLLTKKYTSEQIQAMSLEQNVRSDMSPVFLLHCKGDKTVNYKNSLYYQQALKEKDVKSVYYQFDKEGHGFGIGKRKYLSEEAQNWKEYFIQWLDSFLVNKDSFSYTK